MSKLCGIRAAGGMIGGVSCDLNWGHDGMVHYNGGDGFYAPQNEEKHRRRQRERAQRRGVLSKGKGET